MKINGISKNTYHLGWYPDNVSWIGEINTYGSQMPGDVPNPLGLKLAQWLNIYSVWIDADVDPFLGTVGYPGGYDLSWFHQTRAAADWYRIWDSKCN